MEVKQLKRTTTCKAPVWRNWNYGTSDAVKTAGQQHKFPWYFCPKLLHTFNR